MERYLKTKAARLPRQNFRPALTGPGSSCQAAPPDGSGGSRLHGPPGSPGCHHQGKIISQ